MSCSVPSTQSSTNSPGPRVDFRPSLFLRDVLGPRQGRKKFLARLGPEANDALDEFLNLALDYEARETPSLQGFLAWLRAAQSEVQARHGDGARRGARDDGARRQGPRSQYRDPCRHHNATRRARIRRRLLTLSNRVRIIWAKRKQDDASTMEPIARAAAERAAINEYRRLLYVAMTRAAERLVVCGSKGAEQDSRRLLVPARARTRCAAIA